MDFLGLPLGETTQPKLAGNLISSLNRGEFGGFTPFFALFPRGFWGTLGGGWVVRATFTVYLGGGIFSRGRDILGGKPFVSPQEMGWFLPGVL